MKLFRPVIRFNLKLLQQLTRLTLKLFQQLICFNVKFQQLICFNVKLFQQLICYPLANEVAKGYSNATVRPSFRPSFRNILVNTLDRINILQWILTKLGTYIVLRESGTLLIFKVIDQRSRSPGQIFETIQYALCHRKFSYMINQKFMKLCTLEDHNTKMCTLVGYPSPLSFTPVMIFWTFEILRQFTMRVFITTPPTCLMRCL